jgi:DNA-binding LacI/PurR family transcriptional regulator/AraC-like DNA-binding protein
MTAPAIFFLEAIPGDPIQATTLAGIRRYAAARGWGVESVMTDDSRPDRLQPLLRRLRPAGCIIDCADGRTDLPPRLFGKVPVVYLHCPQNAYGTRALRVASDNEAIAAAAFRELSLGRPASYGVVGFRAVRPWSRAREQAFTALANASGSPCRIFRRLWGYGGHYDLRRAERLAKWLAALPRHSAVFAVNDATAAEVVKAARAAGRDIPHDLTLLGVDDNRVLCEACSPSISSIRMDYERAGFLAARMLGETLACHGTSRTHGTPGAVHPSQSSHPAPATILPLLAVRRESTRGSGRHEPYILTAVEIIRREACDGLTAGELARRLPGTRRLLEMRFREAMGHSILDEIMHVRMERVQTLLASTDTPIGAIADFCGFGSDVELRHVFRAQTKMSLREWRKRNRG